MIVKIDITDIKDDDKAINERIESQYPYMPYMPMIRTIEHKNDKIYAVVSVLVD